MKVVPRYQSDDGLREFDTQEECYEYELNCNVEQDEEAILNNLIFFKGEERDWNIFSKIESKQLIGASASGLDSLIFHFLNDSYLYIRTKEVFAWAKRQKNKSTIAELIYAFGEEIQSDTEATDEIYFKINDVWKSGTQIYNELQQRTVELNTLYNNMSLNFI